MVKTDFSTTRWAEYFTSGTSANGSASIDKARMPYGLQQEYQGREYLAQALVLLDSVNEEMRDLKYIINLLDQAATRIAGSEVYEP